MCSLISLTTQYNSISNIGASSGLKMKYFSVSCTVYEVDK